jgi:hypothetical protein
MSRAAISEMTPERAGFNADEGGRGGFMPAPGQSMTAHRNELEATYKEPISNR